ncbi:MAG TPA: TIM barrel protein [Chloroflexi bacterium]|jgi:mannonate dehydratase|nr:TIM barrel protein [Chloroflexota bacterium]
MHVGEQVAYSPENLRFTRQMGVKYIDTCPDHGMGLEEDGYWHVDAMKRLREEVESYGLELAAMHLPLTSGGIERQIWPNIMLGTPERDRDIEKVVRCIEAAAAAGVPLLLYNLAILPVVRSPHRSPGRGGVTYSHFDYDELKDDPPLPYAPVTADEAWERIAYFIERVIPVAEEYGVRMGCHQHDPGMPPGVGYRGIERVLGSLEGVKRFIDLNSSPYHGLNFCQGTISEMCTSPEQVYEAIEYFGSRKRIFWVHFRNIRGGFLRFDEVFPDEGNVDMVRAMRTYKKVGYDGVLVPDHVPHSDIDTPYGHRARAYCLGYIRALIQAVESEAD